MALVKLPTNFTGDARVSDWNEIKDRVEQNDNILTVTMEELRNAHGAGKLGVHIRDAITSTLAGFGLGHVPEVLPTYQHELVRLYKHGTPVGELIATVLTPGGQNDAKLVERFAKGGVNYASIVERVRELVND